VDGIYLQTTSLPYENTYLDLDPMCGTRWAIRCAGSRRVRSQMSYGRRSTRKTRWRSGSWRRGRQRDEAGLCGAGREYPCLWRDADGDDAETNVVNKWGFSHEAPNLAVLGASVMGTSGSRNPTETAQALAWRTADWLVKNWKSVGK